MKEDNESTPSSATKSVIPTQTQQLAIHTDSPSPASAIRKILEAGPKSPVAAAAAVRSLSAPTTPSSRPASTSEGQAADAFFNGAVHTIKNNMGLFELHPITAGARPSDEEMVQMKAIVNSALMTLDHIEGPKDKQFSLRNAIYLGMTAQLAECHEKGITTTLDTKGITEKTMVHGSQYEYASALTVLVNNAAKYAFPETHSGEKKLSISIAAEGDDSVKKLTTTVTDNGAGIPAEKAKSIFEPKTKSASSHEEASVNTSWGLGLPTISQSIKGYGTIECQSEPGNGARFTMVTEPEKAPAHRPHPLKDAQKAQAQSFRYSFTVMQAFLEKLGNGAAQQEDVDQFNAAKDTINKGIKVVALSIDEVNHIAEIRKQQEGSAADLKDTVLVIEDNQTNQKIAKRTLESMGYNVLVAANGKDALESFGSKESKIGLVLLDLGLESSKFPKSPGGPEIVSSAGEDTYEALAKHGYKGVCVPCSGTPLTLEPEARTKQLSDLGIRTDLEITKPLNKEKLERALIGSALNDPSFKLPPAQNLKPPPHRRIKSEGESKSDISSQSGHLAKLVAERAQREQSGSQTHR